VIAFRCVANDAGRHAYRDVTQGLTAVAGAMNSFISQARADAVSHHHFGRARRLWTTARIAVLLVTVPFLRRGKPS
jgi:hypothetical protein